MTREFVWQKRVWDDGVILELGCRGMLCERMAPNTSYV